MSDDRDMFGNPKNRAKSWDSKKSRDPKKDRRKSKTKMQDDLENTVDKKEEKNK